MSVRIKVLQSGGCKWHLVVFNFNVQIIKEVDHFFLCDLCFLFCEIPVRSFAHFSNCCFSFQMDV